MIFDKVENLRAYAALDKGIAAVADFCAQNDLTALENRRYDLPDGAYANVSEYCPNAGDKPEVHREYCDLQLMVTGSEIIEVTPISFCSEPVGYKPDIDFYGKCENTAPVTLAAGTFLYLAPQDAHRPCVNNGCDKVKKIVFKLPIEK